MALSATAQAALLGAYTDDPVCVLLEISHPDLAEVIRVTNNGADLVSNGNTYQHFPFVIELPGDTEDAPVAKLRIANVDRQIGDVLEGITTSATCSMSIVLASDPDTLEIEWQNYELRNVTWTALEVSGDLIIRTFANEPFPNVSVRESNFPNLYK
jgi:hypothetical protein